MHRHGDAYPTTYFIVFVLGLELVFAENYVELVFCHHSVSYSITR